MEPTASDVGPVQGNAKGKAKDRLTRRQRYLQRWATLKSERASWDTHWREIADVMLPRRFRKNLADVNRGKKKNEKILNPVAQIAIRTLAAGMMAGVVSPSRPWMRLTIADEELVEAVPGTKEWLHECTTRMLAQFARTNFYRVTAGSGLRDLGGFGTHASVVLRDRKVTLRFFPLMLGSYALASSFNGEIDTLYRESPLTVKELVEEFGEDAVSTRVRKLYDEEKYETRIPVLQVIEPNPGYDRTKADARGMKWRSCWMESANGEDKQAGILREGGHRRFPALCPRWSVDGEDTYGSGPGMDALPAARQAQKLEYRHALLTALLTTPPQVAPAEMEDSGGVNASPGGVSFRPKGADKVEPLHDQAAIERGIQSCEASIKRREERIREAFFVDFWLSMLEDPRTQPATAEEVRAKKEERMLQLGPVLEAIQAEYLAPAVDLMFDGMLEDGLLPPPPQQLVEAMRARGHGSIVFDVEYVSIAAAAQRALGLTNVRAFLEIIAQANGIDPESLDNVDADVLVQEAARVLGINPKIVKAMEVVKQLRVARAKQAQAEQSGAAMLAATQGAKNLGTTPAPSSDNALGTALAALGPQASQLLPAPGSEVP